MEASTLLDVLSHNAANDQPHTEAGGVNTYESIHPHLISDIWVCKIFDGYSLPSGLSRSVSCLRMMRSERS